MRCLLVVVLMGNVDVLLGEGIVIKRLVSFFLGVVSLFLRVVGLTGLRDVIADC